MDKNHLVVFWFISLPRLRSMTNKLFYRKWHGLFYGIPWLPLFTLEYISFMTVQFPYILGTPCMKYVCIWVYSKGQLSGFEWLSTLQNFICKLFQLLLGAIDSKNSSSTWCGRWWTRHAHQRCPHHSSAVHGRTSPEPRYSQVVQCIHGVWARSMRGGRGGYTRARGARGEVRVTTILS